MKDFTKQEGFDQHLSYQLVSYDETHCHITFDIQKHHLNIYGYVHGGVYYSLSDTTCGYIATSIDDANWVTLNGSIQYIKAAKKGKLDIKATCISKSRNTANIDVVIYQGDILCTKASFTMYRIG
ncbi:MAG TPA: PaaI family thioesterase [Erysipelothrix sp.]|nr:PaaI family thioesterase [Erysipelothrix sp.]